MFNDEARQKLMKGVDVLANAVQVTLGPKGRNVIIKDTHLTKDGISVAKEVILKDPIENIGAQLIKNACAKTCNDAGDGTTSSTILTRAIIKEGMKHLAAGVDPYAIKKDIDSDVSKVVEYINSVKQEVDLDRIKQIATISANNDESIGNLLAEAYSKIGNEGIITMEENKGSDTYIKYVEGTQIERGFASTYFINNTDLQTCEFEKTLILPIKNKLSDVKQVLTQLENAQRNKTAVLLLVENIEQEVLDTIIINKIQNHLKVCVVKVPFELLPEQYFIADKVIVNHTNTTIIAPNTPTRVAVIYVGASTAVELLEKKDRVEDAICAVRSAIEEGIVSGGGFTYLQASKHLNDGIIKNVLQVPAEQIANNAGKCGKQIVYKSLESNLGYNAKTDTFTDLLKEGIIDPAKVTRVALENAASIATMFLLTECVIHNEKPELSY